jgi:hypothetical protein
MSTGTGGSRPGVRLGKLPLTAAPAPTTFAPDPVDNLSDRGTAQAASRSCLQTVVFFSHDKTGCNILPVARGRWLLCAEIEPQAVEADLVTAVERVRSRGYCILLETESDQLKTASPRRRKATRNAGTIEIDLVEGAPDAGLITRILSTLRRA